jgi:cell division protease FtsH
MSEKLPNLCYYSNDEYSFNRPYSEKTAELIDEEVKNMVNEQYERAKKYFPNIGMGTPNCHSC